MSSFNLDINTREGWPPQLRELAEKYPRRDWQGHPNFDDLTDHWLHIHIGFRRALEMLTVEAQSYLDRSSDPQRMATATSRLAGYLINGLHGHHQIEDSFFFPRLTQMAPSLTMGFETLETDHKELDQRLDLLTNSANKVIRLHSNPVELFESAAEIHKLLQHFERFLNRHLTDEEELIVPVILEHGAEQLHADLNSH